MKLRTGLSALVLVGVLGGFSSLSAFAGDMPPNFKVAFIGDSGAGKGFREVLNLIKRENTNLVLHQGDFDYDSNPTKFDGVITEILGENFPYLASIGNHDTGAWDGYQKNFQARLEKVDGLHCEGDLGVKSACEYQGLFFVLSGVGTREKGHEAYIQQEMAKSNAHWKVCSWHKNMRAMQVGGKSDETGWGVYEECRQAGAIIATGHEHSYSRTHLLSNMTQQTVAFKGSPMVLEKGKTFAFVSGLGGKDARGQERGGEYWASIYTSDQDAKDGALFCEFNHEGAANKAHCYFKNVADEVIDDFMLESAI